MFRQRVQGKGLEFKVIEEPDLPRLVVADEGKFRKVPVNMLGNAVKYTEAGRVELEAGASRRGGRQLWLRAKVTDTGIGIDAGESGEIVRLVLNRRTANANLTRGLVGWRSAGNMCG